MQYAVRRYVSAAALQQPENETQPVHIFHLTLISPMNTVQGTAPTIVCQSLLPHKVVLRRLHRFTLFPHRLYYSHHFDKAFIPK
jgi:hypothetical protein